MVAIGLLAACGRGEDDPVDTGQNVAQQQPSQGGANVTPPGGNQAPTLPDGINWDEHVTFTWWLPPTLANEFYISYSENPVAAYLQHRFNVTFNFEQPVMGTESDSMALMMGTGRYTDAIHLAVYTGSVSRLYEEGIIINIAQWLDYMPNLRNIIETRPEIARGIFDDDGRILTLPDFGDTIQTGRWTGMFYRHDILVTMTDDNVQFPSGNYFPITIADWEYMLPLMLEYFQQAGFVDYAPLIVPAMGMFHYGELMASFGATHHFYVRNGAVQAGLIQPGMFEYLSTMRDWFERGWIHRDFAAQTMDMFFMPNSALVFSGAAGIFTGMNGMHAGDRLSAPEIGFHADVRHLPSPKAEGITHQDMFFGPSRGYFNTMNSAIYVGNPDIARFLTVMDFLYSEEGGMLRTMGLRGDQIPPGYNIMTRMGMPDGTHWFDSDGNMTVHLYVTDGTIIHSVFNGDRLPGLGFPAIHQPFYDEETIRGNQIWGAHLMDSRVHPLPGTLSPTADEMARIAANDALINDHRNQMLPMFIMGTAPLNEATWAEFINQLTAFGIVENREIWQTVYDRYAARGR